MQRKQNKILQSISNKIIDVRVFNLCGHNTQIENHVFLKKQENKFAKCKRSKIIRTLIKLQLNCNIINQLSDLAYLQYLAEIILTITY